MDKKLEARIARLEKLTSKKYIKNEAEFKGDKKEVSDKAYKMFDAVDKANRAVTDFRNYLVDLNRAGKLDDDLKSLFDTINNELWDLTWSASNIAGKIMREARTNAYGKPQFGIGIGMA